MRLTEIFQKAYADWTWHPSSHSDVVATFKIAGKQVDVRFDFTPGNKLANYFNIPRNLQNRRFAEVGFATDGLEVLTHMGNAVAILSTVVQICKEFAQAYLDIPVYL